MRMRMPITEVGAYPARFTIDTCDLPIMKFHVGVEGITSVTRVGPRTDDVRDDGAILGCPISHEDAARFLWHAALALFGHMGETGRRQPYGHLL